MNNIIPINRPVISTTEGGAKGPGRPASSPIPIPARPHRVTDAHLRADLAARAMEARIRSIPSRPARPGVPRQQQAPQPRPGMGQRILLATGALFIALGIPIGMLSIVALGPAGLAVAAAAGVVGALLISAGKKSA